MNAKKEAPGLVFEVPIRTGRGQNDREHWRVRAKRVEREKQAVLLATSAYQVVAQEGCTLAALLRAMAKRGPVVVTMTRIAPSGGLDEEDNLTGALKAIRDAMAKVLGLPNDRAPERVTWKYTQARGPWGVRIEVSARKPEVQGPAWTAKDWQKVRDSLCTAAGVWNQEVYPEHAEECRRLARDAEAMARALGGGG